MDQSRFNVTPGARLPPNVMMALAVVVDLALILREIFDVFQYNAVQLYNGSMSVISQFE